MSEAPPTSVIERVMTPLGDTVALEMLPEAAQRASGLFLPPGARVNYAAAKLAKVIDVGPKVQEGLFAGDEVLIAPFHDGVEVTIPGFGPDGQSRVRLVQERAIVAVLTPRRPQAALEAEVRRALDALVEQDPHAAADFLQAQFTELARHIADLSVDRAKVWR